MKLHIASEGVEINPETREIINKKFITKIRKFFKNYPEDAVSIKILIKKRPRWGFNVRCDLDIPGENLYAEETHKELVYAVVSLAKEVSRRLRKQKEKTQ